MRLRKQGWAGLAVAAAGLALAVGALLSGQAEHPAVARPATPANPAGAGFRAHW